MSYVMVDVESDGPIPGDFSMVCFGAVVVEPGLKRSFYGRLKPISEQWVPDALKVSGFTREQVLDFDDPQSVMEQFAAWLAGLRSKRLIFVSDNNGSATAVNDPVCDTSPSMKSSHVKPTGVSWRAMSDAE